MGKIINSSQSSSSIEKGMRLKSLRIKLGHSIHEFSKLTKIPEPTLYSWEKGRSSLSLKGAKKILKSVEPSNEKRLLFWLMNGEEEILGNLNKNILEEILILQDVNYYLNSRDNSVVMIILDDSMLPFLSPGDYVGGIKKTGSQIPKHIGKWCIVETKDGSLYARNLEKSCEADLYNLSPLMTNYETMEAQSINFAAPISWIRKRD
ncbi:MAG: helix-turn-helix transcriptional regulator [Proteobacteria bacterium]|nr:helix-turn-helix transcriptional regulator [Pseudomonadota bacterium]